LKGVNTVEHRDLIEVAYKWVLKSTSCGVAFKELVTCNAETPDVIGFGHDGHSVLIECKVSRSDFYADRKKPFRINPDLGMGTQRFYCCPVGIISFEELPNKWGLLEVGGDLKIKIVTKTYKGNIGERKGFVKNIHAENAIMYSALRRLSNRIDEIYEKTEGG